MHKLIPSFTSLITLITLISPPTLPVHAHSPEEKNETVVHMTDTGFEPRDVEIKQGDTVIFENAGKESYWPASNIHPTHRVYPDSDISKCGTDAAHGMFDACRGIPPGASYPFQFNHPGKWRYHDHLNATLTGTVTVHASSSLSPDQSNENVATAQKQSLWSKIISSIRSLLRKLLASFTSRDNPPFPPPSLPPRPTLTSEEIASLRIFDLTNDNKRLAAALQSLGTKRAMAMLVAESGGGSSLDCHQQAHAIGTTAYELEGVQAFQECNASCHSGCYHGALERLLQKEGTDDLAGTIKRICETFDTRFGVFECYHGSGHGLLAYFDYDLPETLRQCDRLGAYFESTSCYGGTFMENVVAGQGLGAALDAHETKWVNRTDPYYPCNAINQDHDVQYQCYQLQTSWMLTIFNYDFARVARACLDAPEPMRAVCFKSYGRDAAGHTLRNPHKILELCNKINSLNLPLSPLSPQSSLYAECATGAVNVIVDFWGGDLKGQASELCALFTGDHKQTCYTVLAGRLHDLFKTEGERSKVCETFEISYRHLCEENPRL